MIRIQVPATSANLGPGFDCLGLALALYNRFDVEISDKDILENVEPAYHGPDNLFLQAYHRGCEAIGVDDHVHAIFHCDIPICRGLGSSAALITGGLCAASVLHQDALDRDQIFRLAADLEQHPDNAAPAVFGGLTACLDMQTMRNLPLSPDLRFTVFIPNFEVSTEEARAILPASYSAKDAFAAVSRAVMAVHALEHGDLKLLQNACNDLLHEPYRKTLIHDFDVLQELTMNDTPGVFIISGSGSTCLLISTEELSAQVVNEIQARTNPVWKVLSLPTDTVGVTTINTINIY